MIQIKISNKLFFTLIGILIFSILGIVAYSQSSQLPGPADPSHIADSIVVNIGGVDKTLQQVIDDGDITSYYIPSEIRQSSGHDGDFDADADNNGFGYPEINQWVKDKCGDDYHTCDPIEILRYIDETRDNPDVGWVGGGGGWDCKGWSSKKGGNDNPDYGLSWEGANNGFLSIKCNQERAVLCCK